MTLDILRFYRPNKVVYVDGKFYRGRQRAGMVVYDEDTNEFRWDSITNICPIELDVRDKVVYGDKIGKLGAITENTDIWQNVYDNIEFIINKYLTDYKALDYMEDIEKNSFKIHNKRYGINMLSIEPTNEKQSSKETLDFNVEITLTDNYVNIKGTDSKQKEVKHRIIKDLNEIRKRLSNFSSKGGFFDNGRIVKDQAINEIEYLDEKDVAVGTTELTLNLSLEK